MNYDIYLVGVGGQGVLTIAELITDAAFLQGIPVNYYPTEGMAQRGGFVKAQIRLGRTPVGPNIPEKSADLVIAMEVSEALKAVRFIKPGGDFLLWGHVWLPTAAMLGKASYPSLEQVREQIGRAKVNYYYLDPMELPFYKDAPVPDNLFLLGAALESTGLKQMLDAQIVRQAIKERWPKGAERNLFALQTGMGADVTVERLG
jgi:indolepyruvate ferredoxin oxidoreductase beta subunit